MASPAASGGLGLGGLALGGLGPAALLSFAPALLNHLFGGQSPEQKLRAQLMQLLSPQHQQNAIQGFYQQNLASPAYSQAQGTIAAGANATGANLARTAGNLGPGGTSALLSSILPSIVGSQQAQLRTGAFQSAQQQAQQNIQQQIQALLGTQSGPSQTSQYAGVGLESFLPFLQSYLKAKFPNFASVGATPTSS